jgi:hypothetical protein
VAAVVCFRPVIVIVFLLKEKAVLTASMSECFDVMLFIFFLLLFFEVSVVGMGIVLLLMVVTVASKVVCSIVVAVLFLVALIGVEVLILVGRAGQILQHHGWLKFAWVFVCARACVREIERLEVG